MATLKQTTDNLRLGLVGFLVLAIIILLLDNVNRYFINTQDAPFVSRSTFYLEVNTNNIQLPVPPYRSLAIASDSQSIFNVDGEFPEQPETILVYLIERPRQTLSTVENAVRTSRALGFNSNYSESGINGQLLTWVNNERTRSLNFNRLELNWNYNTQLFLDSRAIAPKNILPQENQYVQIGRSIIRNLGFTDPTIVESNITADYLSLGADGFFTRAPNSNQADFVEVNAYRTLRITALKQESLLSAEQRQIPVSQRPQAQTARVYTPDPRKGSLSMIVSNSGSSASGDIFGLSFTDYRYITESFGVFRAIPPEEAIERIRGGKAALVYSKLSTDDYFAPNKVLSVERFTIDADRTELAYFEPNPWDGYLYPIYVVRGRITTTDNNIGEFVFYVDAVARFD